MGFDDKNQYATLMSDQHIPAHEIFLLLQLMLLCCCLKPP